MPVSQRERKHFAVIAQAMAEEKREQIEDALRSSPAERVLAGFLLGAVPRSPESEAALDQRAEAQIGLARAAKFFRR